MSRSNARSPRESADLPDHLAICGATDVGACRADKQGTFVIADLRSGDLSNPCSRTEIPLSRQGILLLICDGMGGAAAGDLAARIAAQAIKHQLVGAGSVLTKHPYMSLKSAVLGANGAVLAEAKAHPRTAPVPAPAAAPYEQTDDGVILRLSPDAVEDVGEFVATRPRTSLLSG